MNREYLALCIVLALAWFYILLIDYRLCQVEKLVDILVKHAQSGEGEK